MKKLYIYLLFFVLANPLIAEPSNFDHFVVEQNITGHIPQISKYGVNPTTFTKETVWLSEIGIRCTISPWGFDNLKATFMCRGPENYKVQTTVDCKINKDKEHGLYLFAGLEGISAAHRNFTIYCK